MVKPRRIPSRQEQLDAQAFLRSFFKRAPEQKIEALTKLHFAETGEVAWPNTYARAASDEDAGDRWHDFVATFPEEMYALLHAQMKLADAVICLFGSARWFGEGLPVYRLGHKRAASLMATSVPAEMADRVVPPFRGFFIELPPGLLQTTGSDDVFADITGVLVHVVRVDTGLPGLPSGEYWRWLCTTRTDLTLWEMNRRVEELIAGAIIPEDQYFGIGVQIDDHDVKVRKLIARLIVSLCLDLQSNTTSWRRKVEPMHRDGKKGSGPHYNVFVDSTPVEGDTRPYLRAVLRPGERKT